MRTEISMAIKIVELHSVSPPHAAAGGGEQSLPLLYFDMQWLDSRLTETLFFYDIKCSESYFLNTIVKQLNHSLSITLKHFLPMASKIIFPLTSAAMPVSRYAAADGDSLTLTIATSDADFAAMTANHPKDADEFHQLVSQMPPAVYSSDDIKFSAVAIQATLFPNQGICIAFTHHHSICDATTLFDFLRTWASINKSEGEEDSMIQNFLPSYGRSSVQEVSTLSAAVWEQVKASRPTVSLAFSLPTHKLRASFILSDAEIKKLKGLAGRRRASSFVAVCAHLWVCMIKSAAAAGEEAGDEEAEYLSSPVDCRARLDPPLPNTYFGNCLVFLRARSTHGRLKGEEGFVAAVEAIGTAVGEAVGNGGRMLDGFENVAESYSELMGKRVTLVGGSLRINPFDADYGWGRAVKFECVHTDFDGAVSLCKGKDGGVELGLSMPKLKMDAFSAIFNKTLCINSNL